MNMQVGDKVKYNFPDPGTSDRTHTIGEILFLNNEKVTILCEDKSIMVISYKNFSRIKRLVSEKEPA